MTRLAPRLAILLTAAALALGAAPAAASPELVEGSVEAPPGAAAAGASTGNATVFLDESDKRARGTFAVVAQVGC